HLEPDLMYLSEDLKREMKAGRRSRADIVVEILSAATGLYDGTTKSDTYRAMGVREMWLVDPDTKEIEVRSFVAERTCVYKTSDLLRSLLLKEIQISVGAVFS